MMVGHSTEVFDLPSWRLLPVIVFFLFVVVGSLGGLPLFFSNRHLLQIKWLHLASTSQLSMEEWKPPTTAIEPSSRWSHLALQIHGHTLPFRVPVKPPENSFQILQSQNLIGKAPPSPDRLPEPISFGDITGIRISSFPSWSIHIARIKRPTQAAPPSRCWIPEFALVRRALSAWLELDGYSRRNLPGF